MLAHQRLELADHARVTAKRQFGVHALLDRHQPQLLEPGDLSLRERLVGEVRQRRPPPQRQRGSQPTPPLRRLAAPQRPLALPQRALQHGHIELLAPDPPPITPPPRDQPPPPGPRPTG